MTRSSGPAANDETATEIVGTSRQSARKATARAAKGRDLSPNADRQAGKAGREGNEYGASQVDRNKSAASELVGMIRSRYSLGVTGNGEPYAVKPDHHVVRMLRGGRSSLRSEVAAAYYESTGHTASQQALADALTAVEGMAGATTPADTHLRVAEHSGAVWIDLGDVHEHAVKVEDSGWSVVSTGVPVKFKRTELTGTLPTPERGGHLDDLWRFLNVRPDDRPVVLAWLVAALGWPGIPHPVLGVFGEQGTGKSTASRTLVSLVDPSPVPLRKPPRDAEQWVTAAASSWVVGVDTVSKVPEWLSDSLCRAVTGDGDVRRALYTDGGLSVFNFRRVLLLNGIDLGSLRGDLAERTLTVTLGRIGSTKRVTEADLSGQWEQTYPRLLGALLDLVVNVRRALLGVHLTETPRMADYARVLAGVDVVLGSAGLSRFAQQAASMAEDSLISDPFVSALRARLTERFEGTAGELLAKLSRPHASGSSPQWPRDARAVTTTLRRTAPSLRKIGWTVEDLGDHNKAGTTRWSVGPPEKARTRSPPCPPGLPGKRKRTVLRPVKNGRKA